MKKTFLFAFVGLFAFGCNSGENKADTKSADSTGKPAASADTKYDYPYTLGREYQDWQAGDQQHAVKAFELERWFPSLLSCMTERPPPARKNRVKPHASARK